MNPVLELILPRGKAIKPYLQETGDGLDGNAVGQGSAINLTAIDAEQEAIVEAAKALHTSLEDVETRLQAGEKIVWKYTKT